jgi:hypothetical protein
MRCQSKKAARQFGRIHELIWQAMQQSEFTLTDIVFRLYGKKKVHPQIKQRCRKVLVQYVAAGYLVQEERPKDRELYLKVRIVDPTDAMLSRREYLEAVRDRYYRLYTNKIQFFNGVLDERLE